MPVCKNCHSRITKFDKDICPVCGCKNPLEGVSSDTIDITHELDMSNPEFKHFVPRRKDKVFKYFASCGFVGVGFIYLRSNPFKVFLWILLNLGIIGGLGTVLFMFTPVSIGGYFICLAISYIINIIVGLYYKFVPDRKDGQGELIL